MSCRWLSLTALVTSNKQYTFEVRADQLTAGQEFVGLQVTETASHNVTLCVVASSQPGADATFSFQDLGGGSMPEKTYRMHQTMVRLVRPGRAGNSAPASKKHPK